MSEPVAPKQDDNTESKDFGYPSNANPYHQTSYDENNPYARIDRPQASGYSAPPAPPAPPAGPYASASSDGYPVPPAPEYPVSQPYGYQNTPYQSQPPVGYAPIPSPDAKSKADLSLIFGIIGLFFFSLIFGILGIVYAKKAEELGADAKVGKILGWVNIGLSVFWGFVFFLFFLIPLLVGSSSGY